MDEKNFLQSIKLEISKNVKLEPYDRIAYYRLLTLFRSEAGMNTLANELGKANVLRRSAMASLSSFGRPEAVSVMLPFLSKNVTFFEKWRILKSQYESGTPEGIPAVMDFIESAKGDPESLPLLKVAFASLYKFGPAAGNVLEYLISIIDSDEVDRAIKEMAVQSLSAFKSIGKFEELLKKEDDSMCGTVYRALYTLLCATVDSAVERDAEDERLYTYSPDSEDRIILDIRVLLGKMSSKYEEYSGVTRVSYISAMIACGHREYLIYVMKALTSKKQDLVTMVLYCLFRNIDRIRDPDKLFRNLISISNELERDSDLIVGIFEKYFSKEKNTRQFHLLQDKMYGYIIVTLETYFETYRKEFMITDVIEKSFPESFQKIRVFMMERLSPDLKKKVVLYLQNDDPTMINHILGDISVWLTYVDSGDAEVIPAFLDMLYDRDKKSRENSAARIDDLNYEKRYLRDRIVRLCRIIERLKISDAASALVNIYNYLKKYNDEKIISAASHALSVLNYSYMLGEIEVMLSTGTDDEKRRAAGLLSLFTEQRSLNIIMEILQARKDEDSDFIREILSILMNRDIKGNGTASQLLKAIIEQNENKTSRGLAVLCLGKCGFESDIEFLHRLFFNKDRNEPKDEIVRAIGDIAVGGAQINRRQLIKDLQDYLRDPGIRVRIYSCILLALVGSKDAGRSIRDMMIIKNKDIQRDMLALLETLKSLEFAFFLISLLTAEYGIIDDIVNVLGKLPAEDLKEIDAFIVNMFQKYERPDIEGVSQQIDTREISIRGHGDSVSTIIHADIIPYEGWSAGSIADIITIVLWIRERVIAPVVERGGAVVFMSSLKMIAMFGTPLAAVECASKILSEISEYNMNRTEHRKIHLFQQVINGNVRSINDELLEYPERDFIGAEGHPFIDRIVLNAATMERVKQNFTMRIIPGIVLPDFGNAENHYELLAPVNFLDVSESVLRNLAREEEKKQELQQKIEAEIKKLKMQSRSTSSVAIARELDTIGMRLQELLDEIDRYVQKRSTDREMIKNVHKMIGNVYNLYKVEISRIIIE